MELAGTPRAGKTTAMHGLVRLLKSRGFGVEVVEERAARCPVWSKRDPDFNIWTVCTTLAQTIAAAYYEADVIVIDRGIFDALCWMDWYAKLGCLEPGDQQAIESFLTLPILTGKIDLVVVMTVAPEEALLRELVATPNGSPGSIVNLDTLGMINDSITDVTRLRAGDFHLFPLDTTNRDEGETREQIAGAVLAHLSRVVVTPG